LLALLKYYFFLLGDIYENATPANQAKNDEIIYENPEPSKEVSKKVIFNLKLHWDIVLVVVHRLCHLQKMYQPT
jgi:hypothetical protein